MVVEDLFGHVKQAEQFRIPDGVIHVLAFLSGCDDAAGPEDRQLLRKIALLNVEARAQIVDPAFTFPEFIQDSDSQRMGKSFEELGLELADFDHDE